MASTPDLSVREAGAAGRAVVLVHGFPVDSSMWDPQLAALAPRYRALAPDLRGFGRSPLPAGDASIDDFADDVLAVLDRRGIARAAVVGLSMGGYVALSIAARRPERLWALVLADTRATAESEEGRKGRSAAAARALREGAGPIADEMVPRLLARGTLERDRALAEALRALMARAAPPAIATALGAIRDRPDRRAALAAIRAPALVIVGGEDAVTTPAENEAIAAAIPGARLERIEGAGHVPNLERPDAFNRALLAFLDASFDSARPSGGLRSG
jgi:3-oxoadipate enol-lactonase